MLVILFALFAVVAFSQTARDATQLLREVAESAEVTGVWHIEGSIDYGSIGGSNSGAHFKLLKRSPHETRFEQEGQSPIVIVCDSDNAWIYSPPLQRYRKLPSSGNKLCSPIVGDWKELPARLTSPEIVGSCGPNPTLQSPGYQLVRGFMEPDLVSTGRITRSLCVDTGQKQVAWEKWENQYGSRVYLYSAIDHTADFPSDAFVFSPPAGCALTDFELPTPNSMGTRGISTGPGISLPKLATKKEPRYGNASRKARIEGTVVLYVIIDAHGVPSDVLVYRPLSPDLDLEAIKAVRQWRFTPGTLNAQATALPVIIEVNFRLLAAKGP